jgi:hypothetical protein
MGLAGVCDACDAYGQFSAEYVSWDATRYKGLSLQFGPDRIGPRGLAVLALAVVIAAIVGVRGFSSPALLSASSAFTPPRPTSSPATSPQASPTPATIGQAKRKQQNSHHSTSHAVTKLGPLLASTQYASVAYRIYPSPINSSTRSAMAGFQISFKRTGSKVVMTIVSQGSSQPPTHQTYAASDKVYFIEASFGDDSSNQEFNLGDDGVIATNAQGRIITG